MSNLEPNSPEYIMICHDLLNAIRSGNTTKAIEILTQYPQIINIYISDGKTPLHFAIESDNIELVEHMTALDGIDLNIKTQNSDGMTPVFMAAYIPSSIDILNHLIKKNADTTIANNAQITPFDIAVQYNFPERAQLIEYANKNFAERAQLIEHDEKALIHAVEHADVAAVTLLLQKSEIDIELKRIPGDGKTALEIAEQKAHKKIIYLIKEKKLLDKISKKIDIHQLADDAFVKSPFLVKSAHETENKDHQLPSYSQYLISQRKLPAKSNFLEYLTELNSLLSQEKPNLMVTEPEKTQIEARRTWTDVVSEVDRVNTEYKKTHDTQALVIEKIKLLGYKNPEKIYKACIDLLQNKSYIVVSFNAHFLNDGLKEYQLLNFIEKNHDQSSIESRKRDLTERTIFNSIRSDVKTKFFDCPSARPRYGALLLMVEPITFYGNSYIVLDHAMKFNSIFNPHDTINTRSELSMRHMPCSFHHLDLILLQRADSLLKSLAECVITGHLPKSYNQQFEQNPNNGGYIEVMLPGINLLSRSFVKKIHFDEYSPTKNEMESLSSSGINATTTCIKHKKLTEFFSHEEKIRASAYITDAIKEYNTLIAKMSMHVETLNIDEIIIGFLIKESRKYQSEAIGQSFALFSSEAYNPFETIKQKYLDFLKIQTNDKSQSFTDEHCNTAYENFMYQSKMNKNYLLHG